MKKEHSSCTSSRAFSDYCNAAINRYCKIRGYESGFGPVEHFGDSAEVVCLASSVNDAEFIAQSIPMNMIAGRQYLISVTMKNQGAVPWTKAEDYKLGSQNPQDNSRWDLSRVELEPTEIIKPGQQKKFVFTVKAPSTPSTYDFQWKMLKEGVEWFGDYSANLKIKVNLTLRDEPAAKANEINTVGVCNKGCVDKDNNCLFPGVRTSTEYCDIDKELKEQLSGNSPCNNNFECKSNLCVNDQCISRNLLEKILDWFKRLFE